MSPNNPELRQVNTSLESRLASMVLRTAFRVHKELGPGLLANAYQVCLADQLKQLGLTVEMYKEMPVHIGGSTIEAGCIIPMLVEHKVVVYICTEAFGDLEMARMRTYLQFAGSKLGLLFNFNVTTLKDGVRRVLNQQLQRTAESARCLDLY